MAKTTTIREIEHTIETLPQADQLKLLERMVKHIKNSLLGTKTTASVLPSAKTVNTLRGALKHYANPAQQINEGKAFANAMKEKHAHR
ncbi:MAG: hypothetical protein ACOYL3_07640 [Desulfuromonadaceae bacterium]